MRSGGIHRHPLFRKHNEAVGGLAGRQGLAQHCCGCVQRVRGDPRRTHSAHNWNITFAAEVGSPPSWMRKNQGRRGKWLLESNNQSKPLTLWLCGRRLFFRTNSGCPEIIFHVAVEMAGVFCPHRPQGISVKGSRGNFLRPLRC